MRNKERTGDSFGVSWDLKSGDRRLETGDQGANLIKNSAKMPHAQVLFWL
jgi:hypothetical protein